MAQILIIDAQPQSTAELGRVLRRAGHDVHEEMQAAAALRVAADRPFDVAIVGASMPEGGLALLDKLRSVQPGCTRVLETEEADEACLDAYRVGTVSRILVRPFTQESLFQLLESSLRQQQDFATVARLQRRAAQEEERELLEKFLENEELDLALQPIVSATQQHVRSFEVLLRSRNPILRSPLAVLQAAERFDAIGSLAWVVARRAQDWLALLPENGKLFINVHPEELRAIDELEKRLELLDPGRVVLELTDTNRLPQIHGWERSILGIQDKGYAISIDNFTDNYNAIGLITTLMPKYMKTNIFMTRGVESVPAKRRLVEMMNRFAQAIGAQLIAQGVESTAQAQALIDIGVPLMQGYLFGRPSANREEVQAWLSEGHGISIAD